MTITPVSHDDMTSDSSSKAILAQEPTAVAEAEATPSSPVLASRPESVATPSRAVSGSSGLPSAAELILEGLDGDSLADRRRLRRALVVAALFHVVMLFVVWPEWDDKEIFKVGKAGKVFVMKQVRFKKPPARQQQKQVPKKKTRKIPIPDPTPDDPEPIEIDIVEVPELEQEVTDQFFFGIPDGPDTGTQGESYEGALEVGNGVEKPVKIFEVQPLFTEEARQARIQGVVFLSGVIDEKGVVRNLEVVKGLPLGLDERALEAVAQWKYRPATLEGKPVAVYYLFRLNFSMN